MLQYLEQIERILKTEAAVILSKGIVQIGALALVGFALFDVNDKMDQLTSAVIEMKTVGISEIREMHDTLLACLRRVD